MEYLQVVLDGCASKSGSKQLVVNGFLYATPFIKNCDISILNEKTNLTIM